VKYFIALLVSFVVIGCGGGGSNSDLDNNVTNNLDKNTTQVKQGGRDKNSTSSKENNTTTHSGNNTNKDNSNSDKNSTQTDKDNTNSNSDKNSTTTPPNSGANKEKNSTQALSDIDIKVMFSKTSGAFYKGGVDNNITDDIKNAKKSIYMAMYELTNKNITQALIDAKNRGVIVKVTTDNETKDYKKFKELRDANISVTDDGDSNHLMHDKFMVIDEKIVWSGSGNYTVYSFYRNYENYVRVKDKDVADAYIKEFKLLDTKDKTLYIGYSFEKLDIYFSPDSDFEKDIIAKINGAKKSVHFLAFSFTNQDIADALIEAKNRGVEVKGVFDEGQNNYQAYSKYDYLLANDIDVKIDGSKYKLHSKVIIIDNNLTITGSYNFTKQADDRNNENSLVIINSNIAKKYNQNFNTIYKEAQ
jgi:phosphatidylserine/phosphatidylglycerophosphate/cardiolipin synthase-like enzyme